VLRNILILSASDADLHRLDDQLRDLEDLRVSTLRLTDAVNGSLRRALSGADLALVCCRNGHVAPLAAIDSLPGSQRPRIVVCGEVSSPEATRLLVRIGVVDLLSSTPTTTELQAAISRALRDVAGETVSDHEASTISVLGAAGGVGASFIACTLAHLSASAAARPTMLVDLDLFYAPMAAMLGLRPARGIHDALAQIDTLDAVALEGYATRHGSGLKLLCSSIDGPLPRGVEGSEYARLLRLARARQDLVVIAANRWFDPATIEAIAESQKVLIVLGQSLAEVRNAVRLRSLLIESLGLPDGVLRVVINRYSDRLPVQAEMIEKAVGVSSAFRIPPDAPLVRRSIDAGEPLVELDRYAPLTRALIALENELTGSRIESDRKPLRRILATLTRSDG
jgi:pilus assembly protein CpaE